MPWPKGVPWSPEMKAKRSTSLAQSGARRKRSRSGLWRCPTCARDLPAASFHRSKRTPNGLTSQCRVCHNKSTVATRDVTKARERNRLAEAARRARIAGAGGSVTRAEWDGLLRILGRACLRCGATDRIQQDHIVPLARGGEHDILNLQPLCRSCNERKQARAADFRTAQQRAAVEVWVVSFRRAEVRGG